MKLRFILPSVIFLFCGLVARAQVSEMYYQGFEVGEQVTYSGAGTVTTQYFSSGVRAIEIQQTHQSDVTFALAEIDFTQNTSLRYIMLEFDHICKVNTNSGENQVGRIYYKRANESESNWHQMTQQHYNMTSGGSTNFRNTASFSVNSYNDWLNNSLSNDLWKSERFDLNNVMTAAIAPSERRLMIKFELRQRIGSGALGKWLIDNIKVSASPSMMVKPTITMVRYPDGLYYPSSRGAEIVVEPKTVLAEGINPDSVYLFYRVGSNPEITRLSMSPMAGNAARYAATIPFCGYDTMMYFYVVARDATTNANRVTFPASEGQWLEYKCIRGVEQPGLATPQFTGNSSSNLYPFPGTADGRSEWVFDSTLLASAGYGPGSMTAMRFTVSQHTNTVTRPRMQIRMKNVPTNYTVDTSLYGNYNFTTSYMHVVYDGPFTINEANVGGEQTVQFLDTFRYAGKDLVMQVIFDNTVDVSPTSIRLIGAPNTKPSILLTFGTEASSGFDAFTTTQFDVADAKDNHRPALVMTQMANLPLLYDLGISELVSPSYENPMTQRPGSLTVKLKNYGALPVTAARVSYLIDNNINGYFDWTGSIAGGAEQNVTISNNINIPAGYHTLCVWVEDTLTTAAGLQRDHEPYNDTACSEFIVCDGPMNGVRRIGGTNADFGTVEEFLYALSRCGVNDSLVVKLAPGFYQPFTVPYVFGTTASHYVVFEPASTGVYIVASGEENTSIVNAEEASYIRFRNINFVRRNGLLTDMVTLGLGSTGCRFDNCSFIDSLANPTAVQRINAMINSGYANGLTVNGCTFIGGKTGIDLRGRASDLMATNNSVTNCMFYDQYECAINVTNQNGVLIDRNEMYDVLSNTNYVLLLNECAGNSRATRNKIYTSHGAGAIGLNNVHGTATTRVLVANNMVVGNDDGSANIMYPPLNVISASWTDVVYNSVKLTAPTRNNVSAVTFGGGALQNSRFLNNVVVSLDNTNYAFNYMPGNNITNEVGHNVYYSMGSFLNRRSGSGYIDLAAWQMAETADTSSISTNPNFVNGSLVDLRTFNRLVKGVGIPLATVPTDMFDTVRSTTATCPGAFEFVSLGYDFEPEALVSPVEETCYMPSQVELKVRIRNSGVNAYSGNNLQLRYRVNTNPIQTITLTGHIPAEDTVTVATGAMLSLPAGNFTDNEYTIKVWTVFANDPNQTNDTNIFHVTSKYHPATPNNDSTQIAYATPAVITPTSGVDTWQVYGNTGAPRAKSELYWYRDTTDAAPFFVGPTLTTDTIRMDTTFYFRQRRAKPIVRITQLEFAHANSTVGLTPSMPYWISNNRKIALQLTNVGDTRANLFGDTIQTISPTSSLNNKVYVFNDSVFIEPGQSIVVQYATGTSANPSMTIHTGITITVSNNSKIAFVYRHNGVIEDAVAMNAIGESTQLNPRWNNIGVPAWVWSGAGVSITNTATAGLIRTNFNGNALDWQLATDANPMFLNTNNPSWIRYTDNGCEGYFASYKVKLLAPPTADIFIATPELPESACGLGQENVTVNVRNYGVQPVTGLVLNYNAGGATVTEAVTDTLAANGSMNYTFATPLNLAFPNDSLVTVKVWANAVAGDNVRYNDTNTASVLSLYTPEAPAAIAARTVDYAHQDTITLNPGAGLIPVWYDYENNAVDTGNTSISEILYVGGTRGVSYMVTSLSSGIIGTGTNTNGNTAYPSPYQPASKHVKQQYIYSASELRAAGFVAGYINAIAFDLQSFSSANLTTFTYDDYYISMGLTSDTIFSANADWKNASQQVFHSSSLTITTADCGGWVTQQLDSPFYWDGTSSLVIQLVHAFTGTIPNNSGAKATYTSKANTTLYKTGTSALSPSTMEFVGTGSRSGNRPNIKITTTTYGCQGPITPYTVTVTNIPAVDMAIAWPAGMDTIDFNSCSTMPVYVDVRNQGASNVDTTTLYYYYDTLAIDSTVITTPIASGATHNALLFNRHMTPGRHTLRVIVGVTGDDIHYNDTIDRSFTVSFCGGTYTIAPTGGDYRSFGEAIDTLNVVGIEGAVTFNVFPGTYQEQVVLNNIPGSSTTNTISFNGTGDNVLLTAAPTQNDNYVLLLDSTSNVSFSRFRIEARPPSGNYGNALVLQKGGNITIDSLTIRVKGSINNVNASAVVLMGDISNLTFVNNTVDSGYYSFRTAGTLFNYNNITVSNNILKNFWYNGINVRGVNNIVANGNSIRSGVTVAGRGLTGIYLASAVGTVSVQKNNIVLMDDKSGGKRGIQFENINCVSSNPALIANNMISCSGTGTAGLTPAKPSGIWIDSSSTNINVYFNTARVYCGPYANAQFSDASYTFYSGATVSNLRVMNNIFSNFSKGYAYYVAELNTVAISNYNDYYTVSTRPFAWKQTATIGNLVDLQNANSDDANSVFLEPYFRADDDLHLVMTNLAGIAQYNTDVPDDIDGIVRKQVPGPTIGASEMDVHTHDMAVVRIVEPVMPTNFSFSFPNNMPPNIESDSVRVIAQFYNNGMAPESGVQWYAYIEGHESTTTTSLRSLGSFTVGQSKFDTVMMPTVLGITDTNLVHVVVVLPIDNDLTNNDRPSMFYLAPAYNLGAERMSTDHTGCSMQNTTVRITVKNAGFKDIPTGTTFKIGYFPLITSPATITYIPTMPDTTEAYTTLTAPILIGQTATIDFPNSANFYPTGESVDIKFRLMGWVYYDLDITRTNDSTNKTSSSQSPILDAYFSPEPPIGYDTVFPYGTHGEVRASQINSRPIRWYRDSTAAPFFTGNNYNTSRIWNNTPQYFHDSTYFLNCLSTKNCPSYFSRVTVHVAPNLPNDMAFEQVLAPLGHRVYMENDTVRVRIVNYGTSSQTNVPVAYQLKRGNNVIQDAYEICPATIPAGQSYDYTFNTLLDIPTPTTQQNYSLKLWTDLATDGARRNDTIRVPYTFHSLPESQYSVTHPSSPTFDITRVSFNEIDYQTPQQGRGYTNLVSPSYTNPDYPVLHVSRGLTDSILIEATPLDGSAQASRLRAWVLIDFNRDGVFNSFDEELVTAEVFNDRQVLGKTITISNNATPGYMRMRVAVAAYADFADFEHFPTAGIADNLDGHIIDFLLFVDPDPVATDIAVTQIVSPRSYIIADDTPQTISFRIANKGTSPANSPSFNYSFQSRNYVDTNNTGVVTYPGTLAPGTSAVLSLPEHVFPFGVTSLYIWSNTPGDEVTSNDTLAYEYNRFHIVSPPILDSFDLDNKWYAPKGYNVYAHNYWELGTPTKQRINSAYSGDRAWVTDLHSNIVTGTRGNVSYLYSPIINISQIAPDTIWVRVRRNLINGSYLRLEFLNFEGQWVNAQRDSLFNWYNNQEDNCFDGTTSGSSYNLYYAPTNYRGGMRGDFAGLLQFRFVYVTPVGSSASAAFGEGCAIDNFAIGRARRPFDGGIVDIVEPAAPAYGQTIYPSVVLHNYGTDTLREITVGYIHYGTFLPKESHHTNLRVAPEADTTIRLTTPFIVTSEFPETFEISAFTISQQDIYYDNDSCTRSFDLAPLDNDISAHSFIYPLDQAVAGDSLQVTIRMRNFGRSPISHATCSYIINGNQRVDEEVDVEAILGHPLPSMEHFNYTFNQRFRAPLGTVLVTGIVKSPQNDYIYNDTITKRIECVNSILDITAASIIVDTSAHTDVSFTLVIENRGGRGANGFEVGFYVDGDTSHIYREVYSRNTPLPALGTGYHTFQVTLPQRTAEYLNVVGFVHADGDNDLANDTTNVIAERFFDLEMLELIVVENASDSCAVYAHVLNRGNVPFYVGNIHIDANINNRNLSGNFNSEIGPGRDKHYKFSRKIVKDPNRSYVGSSKLTYVNDVDSSNNQSTVIRVVGYLEGVPFVEHNQLVLDQNYPNPFDDLTTIPFELPNDAEVKFFVLDGMGHLVNSFSQFFPAGQQRITLDLSAYSSGIYYYGIIVDGKRIMRKMILR